LAKLVVCNNRGVFRVFRTDTFKCIQIFEAPRHHRLNCFVLLPPIPRKDKTNAAAGGVSGDGANEGGRSGLLVCGGEHLHSFTQIETECFHLADDQPVIFAEYNPVLLTIITVAGCGVKLWSALTGALIKDEPKLAKSLIRCVSLDARKRRMFIGDDQGRISVFNCSTLAPMATMDSHKAEVSCLVFSRHSKELLSGSWDFSVAAHDDTLHDKLYKVTTLCKHKHHKSDVVSLCVNQVQGHIATGSSDGLVVIYDMHLRGKLETVPVPKGNPPLLFSFFSF
jgi:WD40 repeat protein